MDINVKNVEPDVAARLAEQATAEGMSQQQWFRQILRRTASRLSPAELTAQRAAMSPMTEEEYAALGSRLAKRRLAAIEHLGAPGRRR